MLDEIADPLSNAASLRALERDHRSVQMVVEIVSTIADDLDQGRRVDESVLADVIFFLRIFADQCQTAKEESLLFPAVEAKCISHAACPIASLKDDHRKAEALTLELVEAAHAYGASHGLLKESLVRTLRELVELYREHIWAEDYMFLPMAEKVLSPEEQQALAQAVQDITAEISHDEVADRIRRHAKRCQCHIGEVLI